MDELDQYVAQRGKNSSEFKKAHEEYSKRLDVAVMVRSLRDSLGMTQKELAEKVDKPQSTIARIENSSMNASTALLNQIASATGQTLEMKFIPNK